MKYRVDVPYPKLDGVKKNPTFAKLLMHAYAGEVSEESAIHQYFYQSLLLSEKDHDFAHVLMGISEVEMHHFEILGKLIYKLGVYPMFLDASMGTSHYWSSKAISYEYDPKLFLKQNIEAEMQAIQNYTELITCSDDPIIEMILKRLILDERLHIEIFDKLLETFDD